MGHVVFPAPGFDRCHWVDRLTRDLRDRGHRVTVLCFDALAAAFWSAQGQSCQLVANGRPAATAAPLRDFAAIDCRRAGRAPSGARLEAARRRLAGLLPGLMRCFESDPPDLLCLHQERSGPNHLAQFLARERGRRVLWTGRGLLPHTTQLDDEGLDGDARISRRSGWDFRTLPGHDVLPAAALAAVVGRTAPLELARRTVHPPPLRVRLRAALAACVGKGPWTGPLQALTGWRAALAPPLQPLPRDIHLPSGPFVAVLLQPVDDERLRLDADAPPDPVTLVTAAQRAAGALDRSLPVVAVLPPRGLPARAMATLRRLQGVHLELANAAVETCVAATVVVTVNDPVAGVALLAGTPVAHLGRALYGIPGVATKASVESLAGDLRQAVEDDLGDLRKRFLSWMLAHGHVWCCVDHPDHNGINGLVLAIEQRLAVRSEPGRELNYRVGPAWPLTAEGR